MPNEVWERTAYKHKTVGTTEDFVADVKRKQEFCSQAALLRITHYANVSHDVKNQDFCENT